VPVFGVVFPTVVGGGILALPVALAPLGPALALLATVAIGVLNILTIGLLSLAVSRRADSLPAQARLATLTGALLGRGPGALATVVVGVLLLGLVVVYGLGLSSSLAATVGWSAPGWAVCAMAVSIALVGFQLRRVLTTAGTAVTVANVLILAALLALVGANVDMDLLRSGPSEPLEPASFTLVFGTLIGAFFGHTSVPTVAPASLRMDPSGRSLLVGSVAAMTAATVVNSGWVLVTLGSTPSASYATAGSTGIDLVSQVAGPLAGWLALAFVLLALGVAGMISAFVLGDLAIEQLPVPRSLVVTMDARTVVIATDGAADPVELRLTLARDGSSPMARARLARLAATQPIDGASWDARRLLDTVGGHRPGRWLRATVTGDHMAIRTTMTLEVRHHQSSAAVRVLDEGLGGRALALLVRSPRDTAALATALGIPAEEAADLLAGLEYEGVVERHSDGAWIVHLGQRATAVGSYVPRDLPDVPRSLDLAPRSPAWLATSGVARVVAVAPLLVALGLILGLEVQGATFAGLFSLVGIGTFVVVGTTIPLLLAIAARRSADRAVRGGPLDLPAPVLWALWAATVTVCAVYAIVVYDDAAERIAALVAVALSCVVAGLAWRSRALRGSSALVVAVAQDGLVSASLMDAGRTAPVSAPARLPAPGQWFTVLADRAPQSPLRIVVHQDDAPHTLNDLRVLCAGQERTVSTDGATGAPSVDLTAAEGALDVSWRAQ
jgi:hypothetical protein